MKMQDGFTIDTKNDFEFIPRFRVNESNSQPIQDIVPGFPVNKRMKYDRAKMIKAIQNGMVVMILFRGSTGKSKDKWKGGRERVIYPMVLGVNKNTGNELVRGWHLEGFSVSQKQETKKVWRLFKTSGIKAMMFTGHFYRLPPKGYKMNDRVMTEKTIARADFNTIRRNQDALIKAGKIEKEEEVKLSQKSVGPVKIQIQDTNTILDIMKPFNNEILSKAKKNKSEIKISILKTIFSNEYIAIVDALGEKGKTVKVFDENKKLIGSYKTIISYSGDDFQKNRKVNGMNEFPLFQFIKRL